MEQVAGNPIITARVLKEDQSRQDNIKMRINNRSVMYKVYNQSFALLRYSLHLRDESRFKT